MERLFTLDEQNYTDDMPLIRRVGVRGLIRRGNLWAMQHSKLGEYKIPGGGKEGAESDLETLRREIAEETGLVLIDKSVRPIGETLEKRRDMFDASKRYEAYSYFYFCEVEETTCELHLTASEVARGYELAWADLDTIIQTNKTVQPEAWLERDTIFLEWLREHPEIW